MNVTLEGMDGSYQLEAMQPTETGLKPVDLLDVGAEQVLWTISGGQANDAIYADCLRHALQQWCHEHVTKSLQVFWRNPRKHYQLVSLDDERWQAGIQSPEGEVIARFACSHAAGGWLQLLPNPNTQNATQYLQPYLNQQLSDSASGAVWWMPLALDKTLRALLVEQTQQIATSCINSHWLVVNNSEEETPIALFDVPAMALAFLATQIYRQTITLPDLTVGASVYLNGQDEAATVTKAPLAHHLTSVSSVSVRTADGQIHETTAGSIHPEQQGFLIVNP